MEQTPNSPPPVPPSGNGPSHTRSAAPRDPTDSSAPQPELRPLDPRVRPRWWVGGFLGMVQLLVPVLILDLVLPHPLPNLRPTMIAFGFGLVIVAIVPPIRYRRWRYALREEDLWIRSGLLTITVSVIPYRRLQFVDTRSSPVDRLFGLAELVVHTAALGTSGHLPGLDATEAEQLREVLSHVAPDDDAV